MRTLLSLLATRTIGVAQYEKCTGEMIPSASSLCSLVLSENGYSIGLALQNFS